MIARERYGGAAVMVERRGALYNKFGPQPNANQVAGQSPRSRGAIDMKASPCHRGVPEDESELSDSYNTDGHEKHSAS